MVWLPSFLRKEEDKQKKKEDKQKKKEMKLEEKKKKEEEKKKKKEEDKQKKKEEKEQKKKEEEKQKKKEEMRSSLTDWEHLNLVPSPLVHRKDGSPTEDPIEASLSNRITRQHQIGAGKFGEVYIGEWTRRPVALKKIAIHSKDLDLGFLTEVALLK